MKVLVREMRVDDWEAVRAIYLEGIATGEATFETTAPGPEEWNAAHLAFSRLLAVSVEDGRACGWAALSPLFSQGLRRCR